MVRMKQIIISVVMVSFVFLLSVYADEQVGSSEGLRGVIILPDSTQSDSTPRSSGTEIPQDFPVELRHSVEGLYSTNEKECIQNIKTLSAMGAKAIPSIPFLIKRISDGRLVGSVEMRQDGLSHFTGTSVSEEAVKALVSITGQDFGADSTKWSKWWKQQARQ